MPYPFTYLHADGSFDRRAILTAARQSAHALHSLSQDWTLVPPLTFAEAFRQRKEHAEFMAWLQQGEFQRRQALAELRQMAEAA